MSQFLLVSGVMLPNEQGTSAPGAASVPPQGRPPSLDTDSEETRPPTAPEERGSGNQVPNISSGTPYCLPRVAGSRGLLALRLPRPLRTPAETLWEGSTRQEWRLQQQLVVFGGRSWCPNLSYVGLCHQSPLPASCNLPAAWSTEGPMRGTLTKLAC